MKRWHKKFKNRYDWMGKVIDQNLCKRLKFDNADNL